MVTVTQNVELKIDGNDVLWIYDYSSGSRGRVLGVAQARRYAREIVGPWYGAVMNSLIQQNAISEAFQEDRCLATIPTSDGRF